MLPGNKPATLIDPKINYQKDDLQKTAHKMPFTMVISTSKVTKIRGTATAKTEIEQTKGKDVMYRSCGMPFAVSIFCRKGTFRRSSKSSNICTHNENQ